MKKLLLVITLALTSILLLAGCGKKEEEKWADATYTWSSDYKTCTAERISFNDNSKNEKEISNSTATIITSATCDNNGTIRYIAKFNNEAFLEQTKDIQTQKLGHDYQFNSFVWNNNTAKAKYICSNDNNHILEYDAEITSEIINQPTCEADGIKNYISTYDNHTDSKTDAISAIGHNYEFDSFIWNNDTAKSKYICSNDNNHITQYDAEITIEVTKNATCDTSGITKYTATHNNHSESKNVTINSLGHDYQFDSFVWNGYTAKAKYICSNDNNHIVEYDAEIIESITKDATYEENGEKTFTATYDNHTDSKIEIIPATGQNYQFDSFVWTGAKAKAKYINTNDNTKIIYFDATITSEITTPATCEADGTITYTATYDNHTDTKVDAIPSYVHNYEFDSFIWNNYTAKAKYICSLDNNHVIEYDADINSEITTPATCEADGIKTYTATYENNIDTDTESIPATGHEYQFDSFVWNGYAAKAKYICSNDNNHIIEYDAEIIEFITKNATYNENGEKTYTATYDNHTDTKIEIIPATGHEYQFDSFVWENISSKAKYVNINDNTKIIYFDAAVISEITTFATCNNDGIRTYTATYDNHTDTITKPIPSFGHDYEFDSFVWNGNTAKAKYVCSHDDTHIIEDDADVSSEITKEPTCNEDGIRTYTAHYYPRTGTKTESIPKLGHNWGNITYTWSTDYSTCTASRTCQRDNNHIDTEIASSTRDDILPTYNTNRIAIFTVEFTNEAFETQVIEVELNYKGEIPIMHEESGLFFKYGLYPKTHVNDNVLISALNNLEEPEDNGWYLYNDTYYAKTIATPETTNYKFDDGTNIVEGNTYWFKCEPIEWQLIKDIEGKYYLFTVNLIDSIAFNESKDERTIEGTKVYANNYEYSSIRLWLNNDFYNLAFGLGDDYLEDTLIDNSTSTTASSTNQYICNNVTDKIFLPSYNDYTNSDYGFDNAQTENSKRYSIVTDWARAKGAHSNYSSKYKNAGFYWTRSPSDEFGDSTWCVNDDTILIRNHVDFINGGLRIAIILNYNFE